jgi:hypothetical protein
MKKTIATFGLLALTVCICAHPMPNTLIDLSIARRQLTFDLKIPLPDVDTAVFRGGGAGDGRAWAVLEKYFAEHLKVKGMDGDYWQTALVSLDTFDVNDPLTGSFPELHLVLTATPPEGAELRRFFLHYNAILHQILTHEAILSIRQDWENGIHAEGGEPARSLAFIRVDPRTGEVLPVAVNLEEGSVWKGFAAMLRLGMRHIAEGYDHLLFLLLLLVVGPVLASGRRWQGFGGWRFGWLRLLKIVTAFTIGHSLTLALCSFGLPGFSSRWVEVAIAFSILVSALHALVPLFFQKETWVAGGFGLIHGMAFSNTLRQLSLDKTQLLWSLLGFNLGIEAVQLAIVAVAAPLLFWLCQTKAYPVFRVSAGLLGMAAAAFWIWERL